MNWEQYSKRRGGMSLKDFLEGCKTEEAAIARFASKKVDPPTQQLKDHFSPPKQVVAEETASVTEEPTEAAVDESVESKPSFSKKSKVFGGNKGN